VVRLTRLAVHRPADPEPSVAQLLFFVHGMGHHPEGWENDPLTALKDATEQ
jgi:hypothetical protein